MLKETWSDPWYSYIAKLLLGAELNYNTMLFFFFLTAFLAVYLCLRKPRSRRNWILIGNLVFYGWSGRAALFIVCVTALIAYMTARKIETIYAKFDGSGMRPKQRRIRFARYERRARRFVTLALVLIIGTWAAVKIGKLFGAQSIELSDILSGQTAGIIVPLGISYYTLCITAYILDVYWQKTKAEHNFLKLFTAMTYFPYIVQGPFVRYQKITEQFKTLSRPSYERFTRGLQLMLWGYAKKLVIADRIVQYTGTIFGDPLSCAGAEIVLAILLGSVQLYADFSGCMDIIRGISQIIGIDIPENFRQPFFSKSAAGFWRRWHIALGEWTKEYIYLPIAANGKFLKKGRAIKKKHGALAAKVFSSFFPLFAVWLFTGLWHGTGWDYICWGMYWGLIIILGQITEDFWAAFWEKLHVDAKNTALQIWRMVRTFLVFTIGRMWTVVGAADGFFTLWKRIFAESRLWVFTDGTIFGYGMDAKDFQVVIIGILLMWAVDLLHERGIQIRAKIGDLVLPLRWLIYLAAILAVVIFGIYGPGYDAASFVYGNF